MYCKQSGLKFLLLLFALTSRQRELLSQVHPIKLATETYLSVKGDPSVGELKEGRPENGSSSIQRMSWMPESEQPFGYFAKTPVNHFSWQELAISFTPRNTGVVTLELYGPWEKSPGADIYQQDVWWDDVRVVGTELKNGGFEKPLDSADSPWKSTGGSRVEASNETPSADGHYLVKTWHNARVMASFAVTAGKSVTVRAKARAVKPNGFKEMKRIASHDTPAHKAAKRLMRGANLGNHLEVAPDQNWSLNYTDADFDHIREEGFDHIRLPIGWHHYVGSAPEFRLGDAIFAKVDKHIERAIQRNLAIIINIHHFDDFTSDPAKHQEKLIAIWNQLAERYANMPESVFFELLNEPKDAATTAVLNPIFAEVIHRIRQTNPNRTILVGPGQFNAVAELSGLMLPDDDQNLIVTVHNYDPFQFTHQGTSWTGPDRAVKGIRFPGPPAKPLVPDAKIEMAPHVRDWLSQYNTSSSASNPCSEATLREVVGMAKSWSDYYGRPIHFGEFGVYLEADAESRANYVRAYRQAFDDAGLGWALWDWKAGFQYWNPDQNKPATGFREALFPKPR